MTSNPFRTMAALLALLALLAAPAGAQTSSCVRSGDNTFCTGDGSSSVTVRSYDNDYTTIQDRNGKVRNCVTVRSGQTSTTTCF